MERNPHKRRCRARTLAGKQCANWARTASDPPRCHKHDTSYLQQKAGRRCTAPAKSGRSCRNWALQGSDPPLCSLHAENYASEGPTRRRCQAITRRGKRCRYWAMHPETGDPAPGKALCAAHAGRTAVSPPPERRCVATNKTGERCAQWAIHGTPAQYGAPLCPTHVPAGDPRQGRGRLPQADDERRCRATTLDGGRCTLWALSSEEGRGLCWFHAFPHEHGRIKHSFYRRVPHFTGVEHAIIARAAQENEPLSPELYIVRFKLRRVLAYTARSDIGGADLNRAAYAGFRAAKTVSRLLRAKKKLHNIKWGPTAAGDASQLLDQILTLYPEPPPDEDEE